MNIRIVITFIRTQVLFTRWSRHDDRENQVVGRPLVVLVCSGDMYGQRGASFIHQNMDFTAAFCPIGRILTGLLTPQWRWTRFAVDGLPFPLDVALSCIEAHQRLKHFFPDARPLPGLKPLMQDAAGNVEPVPMDSFPLTVGPQNVPNAVNNIPIIYGRPSRPTLLRWLGQMFLDTTPQWPWDVKVVHSFRFCARFFSHGATPLGLVLDDLSYSGLRHFYKSAPIFG